MHAWLYVTYRISGIFRLMKTRVYQIFNIILYTCIIMVICDIILYMYNFLYVVLDFVLVYGCYNVHIGQLYNRLG